jgi:hypothetical protein
MKFSEFIGMNGADLLDTDNTLDRLRWLRIQILDIMDIVEQTDDEAVVIRLFDILDEYIRSRDFASIVASALDRHRLSLAVEFEVAESTVDRWADGSANPHPLLRVKIMNAIKGWEDECGQK